MSTWLEQWHGQVGFLVTTPHWRRRTRPPDIQAGLHIRQRVITVREITYYETLHGRPKWRALLNTVMVPRVTHTAKKKSSDKRLLSAQEQSAPWSPSLIRETNLLRIRYLYIELFLKAKKCFTIYDRPYALEDPKGKSGWQKFKIQRPGNRKRTSPDTGQLHASDVSKPMTQHCSLGSRTGRPQYLYDRCGPRNGYYACVRSRTTVCKMGTSTSETL
jgi:hypothetical protein